MSEMYSPIIRPFFRPGLTCLRKMRQMRRGVRRHVASFSVGTALGMFIYAQFFSSPKKDSLVPSRASSLFDSRPEYDLVVLILSSVGYTDRRHAIRDSWLSFSSIPEMSSLASRVKPLFLVGNRRVEPGVLNAAYDENRDHGGDILFVDTNDDFDSLTAKVIAGFAHVSENYRAKHVLKVDDDSYANIPALVSELETKPKEKFYWGYFRGRSNVKKEGKYEEGGWFLCDRYLPYALGGGYVLSSDLVEFLANAATSFRSYRAEDVTIGTWLAPLEVTRQHDVRFDTEYRSRGCSNDFLVTHKKSPLAMDELHAVFVASGGKKICSQEVVHIKPYVYNWDVLPTKCCERPLEVR